MRRRTDLTLKSGTLTTEPRSLFAFRLTVSHVTATVTKISFWPFKRAQFRLNIPQNITDDVLPIDRDVLPPPALMRLNQCNVGTLTETLGYYYGMS